MDHYQLCLEIRESLYKQEKIFNHSLILNPSENTPLPAILAPCSSFLHGLYNSDKKRNNEEKKKSKVQFSNRDMISKDVNNIYDSWAKLLKAEELSMRLLSGLHAHVIIFMAIAKLGDRVLYLQEEAGGHFSTKRILERLGLETIDFHVDFNELRINKEKTEKIIDKLKPQFIFVDRSEGLIYEDFSWLKKFKHIYKIFDASQYLTNIIAGDYLNPFEMGFDCIISTMHKNLPGPQRAFVCAKESNRYWELIKESLSIYVSNMHVFSIYSAGLLLEDYNHLLLLSRRMLENSVLLENRLQFYRVPVVKRPMDRVPTHHLWIDINDREEAFDFYLNLERTGLLVNYRLLPYGLGYGIRMGTSSATYDGLSNENIDDLAYYIGKVYHEGYSRKLEESVRDLIGGIKRNVK